MSVFLKAEWKKLAIANYAVDPSLLKPYIPAHTSLDYWDNKCYISLVGFMFLNTAVKGIRIPFHINFEEVNLRFYVQRKTEGSEPKRGVVFIREFVPRRALTFVANTLYKEHYKTVAMDHSWKQNPAGQEVEYRWNHRGWNSLSVTAGLVKESIQPGCEEEFITEHYWGYTRLNATKTSEYGVEHPRWDVYHVSGYQVNVNFGEVYGRNFEFLNNRKPDSVMLAEGSEIIVRAGALL